MLRVGVVLHKARAGKRWDNAWEIITLRTSVCGEKDDVIYEGLEKEPRGLNHFCHLTLSSNIHFMPGTVLGAGDKAKDQ